MNDVKIDDYIVMLREQRNNAMEDAALASARALGLSRELAESRKHVEELKKEKAADATVPGS